jgi:four helix bundle protein
MRYKELIVWQKSHSLTLKTINVLKKIDRSYTGDIIAKQLLRAVTSIGANIAEGYGRHEGKEYLRFLEYSYGSSNEVDNWLMVLKDSGLLSHETVLELVTANEEILRILVATLKKLRGNGKATS